MKGLVNITERKEIEEEFPLKKLFVPLTTLKAIHWIVVIGLIVFFNGLLNNFVQDDNYQIGSNLSIHSIINVLALLKGSTFINLIPGQTIGVYYKPITITFFSLIYSIFGQNAFPFHLFQLFIYIINCSLLFFLLQQFFKPKLALLLSLIFLVHPINSEVAYYISDTQDLLFFFFGMVALLTISRLSSYKNLLIISLCLLLSLLAKETGVLFILIGIIYTYLFRRKYTVPLIFSSVTVVCFYVFLRLQGVGLFTRPLNAVIDRTNLATRLFNIPEMFLFYLKTFFFPLNLASSYQWVYKDVTLTHFFLPLSIDMLYLALLCFFGFRLFRSHSPYFKSYLFFTSWFLIGIGMHMQLIPLDDTVSDRWFYFPIVGLLGIIGTILQYFNLNIKSKKTLFIVAGLILILSIRTFVRSYDWRDNVTIFTHDVKVSHSYILYNGFSAVMLSEGNYEEAKLYAQQSIKQFPYFTNYFNLGGAYLVQGDYQHAKDAYFKSLQYFAYSTTYENIAIADVYSNKDTTQNIVFIQESLNKYPQDIILLDSLAILEYRQNNKKFAKELISKVYSLNHNLQTTFLYEKIMANKPFQLKFSTNQ